MKGASDAVQEASEGVSGRNPRPEAVRYQVSGSKDAQVATVDGIPGRYCQCPALQCCSKAFFIVCMRTALGMAGM